MKNILITLAFGTLLLSCAKEDKCRNIKLKLTPETSYGANTLSCKIDGRVLQDQGRDGKQECRGGIGIISADKRFITIRGRNFNKCPQLQYAIDICIDTAIYNIYNGIKRYRLIKMPEYHTRVSNYATIIFDENDRERYCITDGESKKNDSWVELTRNDTIAKIISGRFEFVAYPDHPPYVPVKVTEGRFDWNYPFITPCIDLW